MNEHACCVNSRTFEIAVREVERREIVKGMHSAGQEAREWIVAERERLKTRRKRLQLGECLGKRVCRNGGHTHQSPGVQDAFALTDDGATRQHNLVPVTIEALINILQRESIAGEIDPSFRGQLDERAQR